MTSFQFYQSKPISRLAYRIEPEDVLAKVGEATYRIVIDGDVIDFKAYERPEPGDYVVYRTESEIYHCSAEVFRARNVVED